MKQSGSFHREFIRLAVPVALQGLLQSSFSMVDQILVGQLGEVAIAGIGLAGRFMSLYSVLLSAIAAVAGIMLAQYMGKQDDRETGRSFYLNLCFGVGLSILFLMICEVWPGKVMALYTMDEDVRDAAALYLVITGIGCLPRAFSLLYATLLRCMGYAAVPLYATGCNAVLDTVLSYLLIFGKCGFPQMGVAGAAAATVAAQTVECLIIFFFYRRVKNKEEICLTFTLSMNAEKWKQYAGILAQILVCEFFWSLGENVYGIIYGHIGTKACAAMTLIGPVVTLFMGLMGGVAQAAGILTGKRLGSGEYDLAYGEAKRMCQYGLAGSLLLSLAVVLTSNVYVSVFQVEDIVREMACQLLFVFAVFAPVKVENMILGGGIVRSGGKTRYIMYVDLIGTWIFGVPLGLTAAFGLHLEIAPVYFLLSLEECVRLLITIFVFRKRSWMQELS